MLGSQRSAKHPANTSPLTALGCPGLLSKDSLCKQSLLLLRPSASEPSSPERKRDMEERCRVRKASLICGAVQQQQQPPDSRAKLLESRECPYRAEGSLNSVSPGPQTAWLNTQANVSLFKETQVHLDSDRKEQECVFGGRGLIDSLEPQCSLCRPTYLTSPATSPHAQGNSNKHDWPFTQTEEGHHLDRHDKGQVKLISTHQFIRLLRGTLSPEEKPWVE
ncbi:hypothetical protein FQN60_018362, partial [Etheostoma spectabile]